MTLKVTGSMRLHLINPSNPLVSIIRLKDSRWNRYRVWKPLSLMVLAGLTPPEWDVTIIDENLGVPRLRTMPRPDLVGITAFTSQATRAYEVAAHFRRLGVPVVMGGIHATMCLDEVDAARGRGRHGRGRGHLAAGPGGRRARAPEAPVRRRPRRHGRRPAGPARPADRPTTPSARSRRRAAAR